MKGGNLGQLFANSRTLAYEIVWLSFFVVFWIVETIFRAKRKVAKTGSLSGLDDVRNFSQINVPTKKTRAHRVSCTHFGAEEEATMLIILPSQSEELPQLTQ